MTTETPQRVGRDLAKRARAGARVWLRQYRHASIFDREQMRADAAEGLQIPPNHVKRYMEEMAYGVPRR